MVGFAIRYEGNLRCTAAHRPSRTTIETDAPVDNQGRGERFSPTDLVATGLGVCMLTTMAIAVQREGIRLDGSAAEVEKHMSLDPPRRIARIVVRLSMAAGIPAERRGYLRHVADTCPVKLSLHPDVAVDLSMTYPD